MRDALRWIKGALTSKDVDAARIMYKLSQSEIRAANGRLIAGHPCETGADFLVPGVEFEKILDRLPGDITIKPVENGVRLRSGVFSGTINTLLLDKWSYPDVDGAVWHDVPAGLLNVLDTLRPFISDNATQRWATCVALEHGWAYATNNIAVVGCPLPGANMMALLPVWAVDFVLARRNGLRQWAWAENYVAFRWENEAWMRSSLVVGQFPERAAGMIREALSVKTSTMITDKFRQAFIQVAEMAEDTVLLYKDRIVSRYKQAEVCAEVACSVPGDAECSIWGAEYLLPAIKVADSWSPEQWPKPAPFKGKMICGYVIGRRA